MQTIAIPAVRTPDILYSLKPQESHSRLPAHSNKRILVSWYTNPGYIPPFVLSENQITVGPKIIPDQQKMMFSCWTPWGAYDLRAALEENHIPADFDLIVVWADASRLNLPLNLQSFDCPKLLCLGDTHHLATPLQTTLGYAIAARYDFILSSHNRQHLHWFSEAGFTNVAWLPGLKVRHFPQPFQESRISEVSFAGSVGDFHPRRTRILSELSRHSIRVRTAHVPPEMAAQDYASSVVSFNASLNGDLNLRVFEILSAGGCLLTDRLSEESGLDLILTEGQDFIAYDTAEECIAQARDLLNHPHFAFDVARKGHRKFLNRMLPQQRASELLEWVFQGRLESLFRMDQRFNPEADLNDRVRVYELLQELHRVTEAARILFIGDIPNVYISDALDLRRLQLFVGGTDSGPQLSRQRKLAQRCTVVDREHMEESAWDCIVTARAADIPPSIRALQSIEIAPRRG